MVLDPQWGDMRDQISEQLNTTELKFSREQGFFDKSRIITLLIGGFLALGLFFILHVREIRLDVLELDSIAPGYIVAQHEADFLDDEATIILKQEAVRDIGKVYQISDSQIRQRKLEFENFILYNQEWGEGVSAPAFDDIYHDLDSIEKAMLSLRFTDPRTLQRIKELGLPVQSYQIFSPSGIGEEVSLPKQIWIFIFESAFPHEGIEGSIENVVMGFLEGKKWKIDEDIPTQRNIRRLVQKEVFDKYTHISAGSRIIDQGEKVTSRHLAMLQAIKKAANDERQLWSFPTILGSLLMSLLLTFISWIYFKINYPQISSSNRKLFLIVAITLLTLGFAKATEFFLVTSNSHLYELVKYPLFVPFAAILLCCLINPGVATFATGLLTILLTMSLVFDAQGFMIMNLVAALVAILTTHSLRRRKEIFIVCGKAWLACVIASLSIHLYTNTFWKSAILSDAVSAAVFLLLTAILVVGLMPLLESSFKVMTDATLMEYMDPNNDLLRRLSIEAPGTYQHSVVVGNLAETAALAINANGLFCRVATLYHDIGKMATPQYFTENQQGGMNMHQLLTPLESAQVIIAHVSEGVALARKAGLPEQFIDVIKEHHGTTLVYYFYRKQLDLVNGDKSQVDEKEFRYGGPKPRSKEAAIIMLADTIEAASRSLDKVSEETLMELANRLVREKAEDGQFDKCLLTFEELAIVKAILVKTLVAFGHSRVKYPKKETEKFAGALDT